MKVAFFTCFLFVAAVQGISLSSLKENAQRKLMNDDGKTGNILGQLKRQIERQQDGLMLKQLMHDRIRRAVSQYPWNRNSMLEVNPLYIDSSAKGNDNRPENYYEGLKNVDVMWNDNSDDDSDEGTWLDSFTRPHYELIGSRRASNPFENIFKTRQGSDQGYKNYFKY